MVIGSIVARWKDGQAEARHRAIRRLLGRHIVGSSDPAYWTKTLLARVRPSQETMGNPSYADAIASAIANGDFRKAIFAARLSHALEQETRGDELTDMILNDSTARQLVEAIDKDPKNYERFMPASAWTPALLIRD